MNESDELNNTGNRFDLINEEKEKKIAELMIINRELIIQNKEQKKRVDELILSNEQLKFVEDKITKANRLHDFSSKVNKNILRIKDEAQLFHNFFRIAIEFAKFKMAWIGMFDSANKKIILVGQSGISAEDVKLFSDIPFQANGPQDYVIRTGTYYVCNDMENDFELQNWKEISRKHGILSCMALPIKKSGIIIGTFNLYAGELNYFDSEEIKLLTEVADDISFALDILENSKKQKETENLIIKNEKRFRALIENSSDMQTLSTETGEIFYGSPSIKNILGYSPEEISHTFSLDFIHPDDIQKFIEGRKKTLQTPGQSYRNEIRLLHKNGNWMWCDATLTNMLHEPGINALVSNFSDISERKIAKTQLDFDNNNLYALINNTSDLMWSVDRDLKLITSNQPFERIIHHMGGNPISKGDNVLAVGFPIEQISRYKAYYDRAFAGEAFTEIEYSELPFEIWSEISFCPIRKGLEVIGTACHSRDITARKRSEKNLSKSEARLQEAQALSHISNWEIDLVNNIHTWSDEFYKINGVNKNEVQPSTEAFLSFIHPDDIDFATKNVQYSFESLIASSMSFRFIRKDGEIRHGYSEWKFEFGRDNEPIRLYGILQDVTDRRSAEEEREKITADLIQRNKDLEQFTYIVSHNLRAPVANIIGISEVLRTIDLEEAEKEEMMYSLSASVLKLNGVILDLNDILQTRRYVSENREVVSLAHLIKNIGISISDQIKKEHVEIKTDFSEIDKLPILKSYLYSIMYNLISNSIKYRQPHLSPTIEIKSYKLNDKIEIHYSDNGLGIDLENKGDQVFGLYKRFHTHKEGKGMGLFMVKTQVETLGGKISIKSQVNKGTKFIVQLPL